MLDGYINLNREQRKKYYFDSNEVKITNRFVFRISSTLFILFNKYHVIKQFINYNIERLCYYDCAFYL